MRRDDLGIATTFTAPSSELERLLCQAMAEALELDAIGVDDDFFALGGDSQAAEQLFLAIEEATGCRLPLATLYEHSTVRGLAGRVSSGTDVHPRSAVLKLRGSGAKPPLFIVPGIGGEAIGMEPLVRHLHPGRPVYCCQFVGSEAADAPLESVEEMTAAFLPHIYRLQPTGPYHLLGACFGGLVALELAQRLSAEQHEVGLLCLCDTPFPNTSVVDYRARLPSVLGFLAGRIRCFAHEFGASRLDRRTAYLLAKTRRIVAVLRTGKLPRDVKLELAKRRLIDSNRQAARRYAVRRYAGDAVYVRSGARQAGASQARRDMWREYFGGALSMHTIACRDSGDLFHAHAGELAAIVSTALCDRESETSQG